MKKLLLIITCFFALQSLHAQSFEFSAHVNSGLFHYSGASTAAQSYIVVADPSGNHTNNPYGNKNALSYGVALQEQFTSKGGFIIGLQGGYDILRSALDITGVLEPTYQYLLYNTAFTVPQPSPAKGTQHLTTQYVNINPYIGYRVNLKKVKLDLMPGIDLAFSTSSRDKATATTTTQMQPQTYKANRSLDALNDVRLRFGAAAMYRNFGIGASFAHGLTNDEGKLIGSPSYEAHEELIRFGLSYRIL